jgi:bacillithiol synthase
MESKSAYLDGHTTNAFSALVTDYLDNNDLLSPFYSYSPTLAGIQQAMQQRMQYNTNRSLLVQILNNQYSNTTLTAKQQQYLQLLSQPATFTICTAHQPNLFTGHLYFIYKILHAVKLAETLTAQLPGHNFVPVYYMGSEDADLDELGHVYINGIKYEWQTKQTGAVGRMKVDGALLQLLDDINGQLSVQPFGAEIVALMRQCYTLNTSIEQATFTLVNQLFAQYGLLVLLPDNAAVKNAFIPVMQKELLQGFSQQAVQQTMQAFPKQYKVQASGRDINLFYLQQGSRERIEKQQGRYVVVNTAISFTEQEILQELQQHPERFSPNVILRPVLQETILPNVAFIGGGGELAYWLELKKVFEAAGVPYPVLLLRNSFLLLNEAQQQLVNKLGISTAELFLSGHQLINSLVKKASQLQLTLDAEKQALQALYQQLKNIAGAIDTTLQPHTDALHQRALSKIEALEKKMLKAEKLKFAATQRQAQNLKAQLFPQQNLQERVENLMGFYALWGSDFIHHLYQHSLALEQQFAVLQLSK